MLRTQTLDRIERNNEVYKKGVLNFGWQLFKDYIFDAEIADEEDKQIVVRECVETAKYYIDHAPKILNKMLEENATKQKGITRNFIKGHNRTKPKSRKKAN